MVAKNQRESNEQRSRNPRIMMAARTTQQPAAVHGRTLEENFNSIMNRHTQQPNGSIISPVSTVSTPMRCCPSTFVAQPEDDPLYYHPLQQDHNLIHDSDSGKDENHDDDDEEEESDNKTKRNSSGKKRRRKKPTPQDPGWTALHHRRHFVRHNYHDHSCDKEECPIFPGSTGGAAGPQVDDFAAKGGVSMPFPLVLHNMLDAMETSDDASIVSWQPHGRAFCVHDCKAFVSEVMPRWFRQSKISSFQRQLNLYGFSRLTSQGPDRSAYYNEFFLRGRPDLTVHMHRTRVKGTGVRTSSNPMEEPNFYEMEQVAVAKEQGDVGMPSSSPTKHDMTILPTLVTSSNSIRELRHDKEMMEASSSPVKQPTAAPACWKTTSSSGFPSILRSSTFGELPVVPELMDLEDVDVKDMALFLQDVDLSSDGPPNKSVFGMYSVDLSGIQSTSV
eukprot:CAMPEP_0119018552 /NCGR_PEP_ID=MMETSP1176-20130426/19681_1 /TAXON_ID=265551 /ORGANISM="Synedropsis recta cf, Strain CCMP1620" /LENGTH=445 /DNA_ID=CAMNT_0006972575 /DNA_START=118 /DNA_END=1455 /DNA_ORIENTATION=+